jgi:hypothetical protein
MPINFTFDPDKRRVHFTVAGTFTLHDILGALESVLEIPGFGPGLAVLSDHRGIERPASVRDVEDMLAFMRDKRDRFQDVRWAVVTHRPSSYAVMGLLSTLADLRVRMTVRVFTRLADAEAWLDEP